MPLNLSVKDFSSAFFLLYSLLCSEEEEEEEEEEETIFFQSSLSFSDTRTDRRTRIASNSGQVLLSYLNPSMVSFFFFLLLFLYGISSSRTYRFFFIFCSDQFPNGCFLISDVFDCILSLGFCFHPLLFRYIFFAD